MIGFFIGAAVMAYLAWWVGVLHYLNELHQRIKALEDK